MQHKKLSLIEGVWEVVGIFVIPENPLKSSLWFSFHERTLELEPGAVWLVSSAAPAAVPATGKDLVRSGGDPKLLH